MQSNSVGVVSALRWNELFPGLLLVRALRSALAPGMIALAMLGVAATHIGWRAVDAVVVQPEPGPSFGRLTAAPPVLVAASDSSEPKRPPYLYESLSAQPWIGPIVRAWAWMIQPLTRLAGAEGWRQIIGFLLAGVWTIAVWALFGGAIARIAALELAREEKIGPLAGLQAAATRWTATAGAPTISFTLILVAGLLLCMAGLLMRSDWLAAAGGLLWFIALGFGVVAAALVLLHLIGFAFMWATVAVERTDSFDAVSRSWTYVYSRPLHLAALIAFASLIGFLAEGVVALLAQWAVAATELGVSWGAEADRAAQLVGANAPEDAGRLLATARWGIAAWNSLLLAVPRGFAVAYFWSVGVAIYLLMRQAVDSTEIAEAAYDPGSPEPSIPKLIDDPRTGVPQVEPTATATNGEGSPPQ